MTKTEQVHNELTQQERRQVQRDTMQGRAIAEQDTTGGRWAAELKTRVTGAGPVSVVPPQPPDSPWASDVVGLEAPLGFSIDAMEPVGTAQEIEQSLGEPRPGADLSPPGSLGHGSPGGETRSVDLTASKRARRRSSKRK